VAEIQKRYLTRQYNRTIMPNVARAALAALALVMASLAYAQAPAAAPNLNFEVASIKPSQPGGRGGGIRPSPGGQRYLASNAPLRLFIRGAYHIRADQIVGGPGWIDTDRYDMNAEAERPSSIEELHIMLQNLLAERFKLRFHYETKELPIYALMVDKNGPKLKAHPVGNAGDVWIDETVEQPFHVKWKGTFASMDYFAFRLSAILDRPVLNQTNLTGDYDFDLAFTQELPPGIRDGALINGAPIDTSGPTVFEALRSQLGLKLEPQKGPVQIMVIDHAERPVEN
jgi:uncharacterized protein (TIGR03435 family)